MSELPFNSRSDHGKSAYLSSSRRQVFEAIYQLISQNLISIDDCFVDLGSGTGDVVLITNGVFGLKSIGLEFDPYLHHHAIELSKHLNSTIQSSSLKLINGDYTDTSLIDYNTIDILYNYFSGDLTVPLSAVNENTLFMSYQVHGKVKRFYDQSSIMNFVRNNTFLNSISWSKRRRIERSMIKRNGSWQFLKQIKNTDMFIWRKTAK